jgi:hypothetical protein
MRKTGTLGLTSVSMLVLGAMIAMPALAQQPGATTPGTTPPAATAPGTTTPGLAGQTVDRGEIKQKLDQAGITEREQVRGHLVHAQSPEGQPLMMVIGPEEMKADEQVQDFRSEEWRDKLTQAGFRDIRVTDDAQMVRGKIEDADDKHVLAWTGRPGEWWSGTGAVGTGAPGGTAQAQTDSPDLDQLKNHLEQVGLEERNEFKGKLMRAQVAGGETLFMLIGPSDFAGDQQIELSSEDTNRFRQHGFEPIGADDQRLKMVQGTMDDAHVIALVGHDMARDPAAVGTGMPPATGTATPPGGGETTPTPTPTPTPQR